MALNGTILLIGRAQPDQNPLRALGFDVCENKPCFRGIIAGKTTMEQVATILNEATGSATRLLQANIGRFHLDIVPVNSACRGNPCAPNETAMFELLVDNTGPPPLTLADIVDVYGEPCNVTPVYDLGDRIIGFAIYYSYLAVFTDINPMRLKLDSTLRVYQVDALPFRYSCSQPVIHHWIGFASARRYQSAP
ncbi:MAG: hypothetical protein KF726_28755 [Anaerolineae bacterium]|nr:hypothetical protein [Anaerolineae bacterium]